MMLNAWHLPVPPFVKQSKDQLLITLWLTGEDPPQRIMLRTEHDNEEMSVPMHKQRSQPQPGVTAWRAAIDLSSGQPRRRYSFKLLWHDRQRWFTPQGFSRMPPARLEQFAVDVPDIGPQWAADQIFYQIFPDRFARSLPREAEQDHVYYHHAAGQEIILRDWDEPVTAQAGGSTFYGGDLDGISEKLPYLKKLGVTALYLNPVFKAPSVHKYDTEDYRHVDPQFGGDGRCCVCDTIRSSWECGWCWTACLTTVAIPMPGLTGTIVARGELVTTPNRPGATGTRLVMMARRSTGLAMPACRSWIISRKVW